MNYETILIEKKENIGIIKLNNPSKKNALGTKLINELTDALEQLEDDPQVYVTVIMSNLPKVFCAGRDLSEGSTENIIEQREFSGRAAQLWLTFMSLKKVVISAVNGYALAGGCGLVVCSDLVIASEDAIFGLPEINVGLFPMTIAPAMIRNTASLKKCFEIFVTGDQFDAAEAEKMGIINRVVPSDMLENEAMKLAKKIASKSPTVLQMGKECFYTMMDMEYKNAVAYAKESISLMAFSDDGREGQKAFKEKRKPQWKQL